MSHDPELHKPATGPGVFRIGQHAVNLDSARLYERLPRSTHARCGMSAMNWDNFMKAVMTSIAIAAIIVAAAYFLRPANMEKLDEKPTPVNLIVP